MADWLGEFPEGFTAVTCMFGSYQASGAVVAPSSGFANTDVIIYKNGSATQKTTTNGITMTSPFDSITGLHCVTIDTSNATGDVGFWVAGAVYTIVLSSAKTVDSIAVMKVIGQFGLELEEVLRPITAGRQLLVSAAGAGDANVTQNAGSNITSSGGRQEVNVSHFGGTAGTFASGRPEVNTTHAAGTAWNSGSIGAATLATDTITAAKVAADVSTEIRALASGTADSGTTTTMVDAGLTQADTDYWAGQIIVFTSGNIAGQARLITAFNAATDTITFTPATTQAVATQTFEIWPNSRVDVALNAGVAITSSAGRQEVNVSHFGGSAGTFAAGRPEVNVNSLAAGSITASVVATGAIDADALATDAATEIRSLASGTSDSGSTTTMVDAARTEADTDYWVGQLLVFTSGNIAGQARIITAFNAGTDTITFAPATTQAVATQNYEIWPAYLAALFKLDSAMELDGSVYRFTTNSLEQAPTGGGGSLPAIFAPTWIGDFPDAFTTVTIYLTSHDSTGVLGGFSSALEAADFIIYKNGSAVQKTTTNGLTIASPFDSVTGLHALVIDTSNSTGDVGFWAAGSVYTVVLVPDETLGSNVIARIVGSFGLDLSSTLRPTTAGRKLDVSAGGEAGLDWANIGSPTTAQNLSATNIDVDQVVASVSGSVASVTGNVGGNVVGSVASVTGNVGGNVTGSVGSVALDGITSTSMAASAVTEIQTGLATSAALATVQADTDDIQTRLPAALVSGRMDSSVGAMATDVLTSTALAASAVTEIQTGLATSSALATLQTSVDDIPTNAELATALAAADDAVLAAIAALNNLSAATVKTQVVDALNVDTYAQPAQGTPPATATLARKLSDLHKWARNRVDSTASQVSFYNDDAATVDHKATLSDDGTTFTRGEVATGP